MRKSLNAYSMQDETDLRRVKEDDPYFAGTLAKGLLIMKCFVSEPRAHANSELAARLGLSRPTVSRLCRTLHALGFLDHDERLDRYFIGPAAVTLAYPYLIKTPMLALVRPAMQALADRVEGAVSVGVTMDLDVVYLETCAYEEGTLKRPGVGAVNGVLETAMGRSWLAQLAAPERQEFLKHARQLRPESYARTHKRAMDAVAGYAQRGYAINMGDSGLGVLAVGVASRIHYGPRRLLFNCAVPGLRMSERDLHETLGPELVQLVSLADRQMGLR
ncbi:HTH-type transcriptional regulator TsaQ1/TsaQ2 [Paraburkholderia caffeinitolerans]|uniref:HTH-type transcriptional regulator TsaQ1/TsaQ2 n=1 Tax=Paraburkholderia caffeinitolerans TaxID=1723730 RepID=A0A6J5FZA5_9BURK|nr:MULTISPECIES: helix-turn-helix domain-containing protein [Paraburkholderia]CAB3787710.1 HTH-type transcriptional regulator TsaQ1/TsaQ2 [Paraburkholderia caffeinitolerans]